jgi:GWxTD domain-containing protein
MKLAVLVAALLAALAPAPAPAPAAQRAIERTDSLLAGLPLRECAAFYELQPLMTNEQTFEYLSLPNARERSAWTYRFWVGLDPTPTTEANERRVEHEHRILLARERYPSSKVPGWDVRGEVLIRYGEPANVGRIDEDISASSYTGAGETWYYAAPRMTVRFQRNLAGEYVCSGDPVHWRARGPYTVPSEPDYCADALTNIELAQMMNPTGDYHPEDAPMRENEIYRNIERRPFVHSCDLESPIPCYVGVTTFRGDDRSPRTDVDFEVPANALEFFGDGDARAAAAEFRVLVRDSTMRKVAFARDRIRAAGGGPAPGSTLLPGQVTLHLKPGRYWMGLEAYDNCTKRRASFIREVEIPPMGGSPGLSGIQFASSIREAEPGSKFAKGNLQVVPHPARAYRIPFPISFYFEIYGLEPDESGRSFYRVEYLIVPLEKRRRGPVLEDVPASVSSSFETSGYGSTQPQRLAIATNELWKGTFRLEVRVTDRRTFRTATRSATFSILK